MSLGKFCPPEFKKQLGQISDIFKIKIIKMQISSHSLKFSIRTLFHLNFNYIELFE